jgi:hypothetical protein
METIALEPVDAVTVATATGTTPIAARLPDAFLQNSVGTRFEFTA